jgi:flagellar hook-basal body complex protein FliE
MAIGPIEGSAIPLLGPHVPYTGAIPSAGAAGAEASGAAPDISGSQAPGRDDAVGSIGDGFLNLVVQANARSASARHMAQAMASGQSDDIHGTMIEVTKASIETRLMVNVKDKVIDAFYEIWRMNV